VDPVSLIVGALAAGASAGLSDTTKTLIGDLYTKVKTRLADRPAGQMALEQHAGDSDTWTTPLSKELAATDPGPDAELVAQAERVMAQVDPGGSRAGKYIVNLTNATGVQVGDHNTQTNTFND
jgi:hypothetical protein